MFKKSSDLSTSIEHDFRPDRITQEGISGPITALAYDPVQSLFAAGTATGMVHVMGAGEIRAVFDTNPSHKGPSSPITHLRFVTSVYLVSIDDRSLITVWALDTRTEWAHYQSPYSVLSCWTDPSMDWLWLGHRTGESTVFDVDRGHPTPWKLPSLEKEVQKKQTMSPVTSLSLHPRDPALLLLCYREVAVVWNMIRGEIVYAMVHEFPFVTAVWHPSGSHVASSHVNGHIVFWDGQKGVRLGARNAFRAGAEAMDLAEERVAEGLLWCCREDPTDTYIVTWGGRTLSLTELGPTPIVATTSYESMGNFYKSPDVAQREIKFSQMITAAQLVPKAGNPHFQGSFDPSHVVLLTENQLMVATLPAMAVAPFDSAVLPPALSWRATPITSLSSTGIARNQWIGMMAAALPNSRVVGGNSATQQIRKLPLATVLCAGCADGSVKLFDATRADSRDYRIIMTTVRGLDPQEVDPRVTHVAVGREVGEMAVATASGNVFLTFFGKNRRPTEQGPPTPSPEIVPVEHLVVPELTQGFVPQHMFFNRVPVTALTNSNIGFVGIGLENGRVVVIDKRGPALIMDETIKGAATAMEFGILAVGDDAFSSILFSVGTTRGDVFMYRVMPRPEGGYTVLTKSKNTTSFSVGKDPVTTLAHVDMKEGKPAEALPDVMARLGSGLQVPGGLVAATVSDAKFFAVSGAAITAKLGKKLGSKSFDTPLVASAYAHLRTGTASALLTLNMKGKVGIYSLPGFKTISTYTLDGMAASEHFTTISPMGDAFVPYNAVGESGQVVRIFGTDQLPKDDEVYQLRRRVPARPQISTAHWMSGRQFVKPSDLDAKIAGKRRGKSKRARHQLVDEMTQAPTDGQAETGVRTASAAAKAKSGGGVRSWFGGGSSPAKPVPKFDHPQLEHHHKPQKTWGQTINEYVESAEDTVNGALDEAMEGMTSSKKQAQSSAVKGIIGSKLGF